MANGRKSCLQPVLAMLMGMLIIGACSPASQKPNLYNAEIVTTREGETLTDLAETYLSDSSKSYIIADFNNKTSVDPDQKIVIPLKPLQRGGLNAYGYQIVPVLRYKNFSRHRSGPLALTQSVFDSQLAFLKQEGYHVVTMDQLLDFLDFKGQLPHKSVVITIDEVRDSVLEIAYPVIQKYGFPATLFIQTDLIGKKGALSWPEVRYLSDAGLDIQCRSATFPKQKDLRIKQNFNRYIKELDNELLAAKAVIQRELGKNCQYLAYPEGPANPIIVAFAEKHGFRAGFRSEGKSNPFFVSNHWIGRSTISGDRDLNHFKQQLAIFESMQLK